ncbi:hypothetical protein ACOSP7_017434 [Xanthoceras sorbifolium]
MSNSDKESLSSWVFELNGLLFSNSEKAALDSWVNTVLGDKEAEFCKDSAEEFFRRQDIDKAIFSILTANIKDPNLPGVKGYFYAYMIIDSHEGAMKLLNSAWEVLSDPRRKVVYDNQLIADQNEFSKRSQAEFSCKTSMDSMHEFSSKGSEVFVHGDIDGDYVDSFAGDDVDSFAFDFMER